MLLRVLHTPARSLVERDNLQAEHVPLLVVVGADMCCALGCHHVWLPLVGCVNESEQE